MLWAVRCGTALRLGPLVRHLPPRSRRSPSPLLAPRRPTGGAPCRADRGQGRATGTDSNSRRVPRCVPPPLPKSGLPPPRVTRCRRPSGAP